MRRPSEQEQAEAEMRRIRSKQEPEARLAFGLVMRHNVYNVIMNHCESVDMLFEDERSVMIKQRVEEGVKRQADKHPMSAC